jgi:hypothetical protein
MTTSVRSLAEQQKFGRIFFHHHSPFSSFRTTKIRQNFFVPSAHSSFSIPVFRLSLWFNPRHLSLSSISAFVSILANRLSRLNPSSFYPPSFLRITRPLPSFQSSFHLVLLLRLPVHDSIILRSWPSWVCRVSNAHGGFDVYPTLASIFFLGVPRIRCSWWV